MTKTRLFAGIPVESSGTRSLSHLHAKVTIVSSDKPSGADNQQGSPSRPTWGGEVTPQRLNAELLAVGAKGLESLSSVVHAIGGIMASS